MERNELRPLLRQKFPQERTYLLPALHYVHHELGHLPDWALQTIGWHLRVPASEVYGAATSRSELRLRSPGRHLVRVCTGLSCWSSGGQQLVERVADQLGIRAGETATDGSVTLEETSCGFLCALAPVAQVDGHWRARLTSDDLTGQIAQLV